MRLFILRLAASCVILAGSATAPLASGTNRAACHAATIPDELAPITQTTQPFVGVTYYRIAQGPAGSQPHVLPREVVVHFVEIDPAAPGVSFFGSPDNGPAPNEFTRQTTSSFVNAHGLAAAINGDFYTIDTGATANVNGLSMSKGRIGSPPAAGDNRDNSLVILHNNEPRIISDPVIPVGARDAVSGNQLLLANGRNVTPAGRYTRALNPHTAVGVDVDTGRVFFMVVDGRQPGYSAGMRTRAMARMLKAFGVDDAINLDGGGSSTLVFADGPGGKARTINSPSDGSTGPSPGHERAVANHLGVFARPNPDYVPLPPLPRPKLAQPDPLLEELTLLDDFEVDEGRFASDPTVSRSTTGITAASSAEHDANGGRASGGCQRLVLVRNSQPKALVRHLSGGGEPAENRVIHHGKSQVIGPAGCVGFYLKSSDPGLQAAIAVDDGVPGATGLERSAAVDVIADGTWRLYQWNLADERQWSNFNAGNGRIDGPNVFVDSVLLTAGADTAGKTLRASLDTVAYNPAGTLDSLAVAPPDP